MSIWSSIGGAFKKAASYLSGPVGTAIGGPAGGIIGGAIGSAIGGQGATISHNHLPSIPGGAISRGTYSRGGIPPGQSPYVSHMIGIGGKRRRRGRGFSARDIRQTRRMLALIKDVERSCPTRRRAPSRRYH